MFFAVTMTHPDGPAWGAHVKAHVDYLEHLVAAGKLKASGPIKNGPLRAGFLIFNVLDRAEVTALVAADPFALCGVIETLTIFEWDPIFGTFSGEASGKIPGQS